MGKLELFAPLMQGEQSLLFLDLRGVGSDDPPLEGNFGLGYRRILSESGVVLGSYGFRQRGGQRQQPDLHRSQYEPL